MELSIKPLLVYFKAGYLDRELKLLHPNMSSHDTEINCVYIVMATTGLH